MPKTRKPKRKTPITAPSLGGSSHSVRSGSSSSGSSHPQATRTTIRRFHVLIKRQAQLRAAAENGQGSAKGKDRAAAVAELGDIEREIEELGGLAAYQRMSTIGQGKDRGGGSEKILIEWLRDLGIPKEVQQKSAKLRSVTCPYSQVLCRRDEHPCVAYLKLAPSSQTTTLPVRRGSM